MSDVISVASGFDATFERYDAEKYPSTFSLDPQYVHHHDQMKERVRAAPEQRITWIRDSEDGIFSFHSVDASVVVKTVSDAYRNYRIQICQNKEKENQRLRNGYLLLTGMTSILGLVGTTLNGMPYVVVAGIVAAIFCGYQAAQNDAKVKETGKQAKLWGERSNLAQQIADDRKKVYEKGFPYVYSHDLKKKGFLQPKEIEGLYKEYLSDFLQKLGTYEETKEGGLKWMHAFLSRNPLSMEMMKYGLGEVPADLKALAEAYEKYEASIKAIFAFYEQKVDEIQKKSNSWIASIEDERAKELAMHRQVLEMEIAKSKARRDEFVQLHHPQPCKECHTAEKVFQDEKKNQEASYEKSVGSLTQYLDKKAQAAQDDEKKQLRGLSDAEILQIEKKTEELLQMYEAEKLQKLKAVRKDLEVTIAKLQANRSESLRIHLNQPCFDCNKAEQVFVQEKQQLEEFYEKQVAMINAECDAKIKEVSDVEKEQLKGISSEAILQIQKESDALIQSLEKEQDETLKQLLKSYEARMEKARADRDEVFKLHPEETSLEHQKGEQNFQHEKEHQEKVYSHHVAAIKDEFEKKIQQVREAEKENLQGISREDLRAIQEESQRLFQWVDQEKLKALNDNFRNFQTQIGKIQAKKEEILRGHPHQATCLDCQRIEQIFQLEKSRHREIYEARVAAIQAEYGDKFKVVLDMEKMSLKGLSREEVHKIQADVKAQLRSIAEEKAKELKPYQEKLLTAIAKAEAKKDQVFGLHPHQVDCKDCKQAQATYEDEKNHFQNLYAVNAASVNTDFDQKLRQVEGEKMENIKKIKGEIEEEILKYFPKAREIFSQARAVQV